MVLFEALHTFSTLVVVYRYCWVDRNPWFMETTRNQCSGIRSGGHGNLSTDHQLWHVTLSLPGIIDLCFFMFCSEAERVQGSVSHLILVYVSITDHSSWAHTIPHTHTTRNQALFEMMSWPQVCRSLPNKPLPSIYLWPAVRRGEGPWSYISKQQQLARV